MSLSYIVNLVKKKIFFLREKEREREEAETQAEGEAGSMQGSRHGT